MWIRRRFELAVTLAAVLAGGNAWADPPAKAASTSDALAAYRERFQLGMTEYRAGAVASAIAYWEPVYLALGPREGYRVAYDLGIAYLQVGDTTLAAARLQSFLDEVASRREAGEVVSVMVTREEGNARARLAEIGAGKAPVEAPQVGAGAGAGVDAEPAPSTATNAAGTEASAISAPPEPPPQTPALGPFFAPEPLTPFTRPVLVETRVRHPVSPPLLLASGALTAVAVAVAIPLGVHTFSLHSRFVDEKTSTGAISNADRATFDEGRTAYDIALGSSIAFGALTSALTAWYFAGSSRENVVVEPVVAPGVAYERGGASVALRGRF